MTTRSFVFKKGKEEIPLLDIDPSMSVDEIRNMYASQHSELTNAAVNFYDKDGKSVREMVTGGRAEFTTSLGKKG